MIGWPMGMAVNQQQCLRITQIVFTVDWLASTIFCRFQRNRLAAAFAVLSGERNALLQWF